MLTKASCYGKWQMEDGKTQRFDALFHLPSSISIQAAVFQRPVRAAVTGRGRSLTALKKGLDYERY
jgi:hypothetical protein